MSEAWNSIRKTADNLLQKTQLNKIDYLALSFLMTDEKKYADKIKEILLDVTEDETWGNQEMIKLIWCDHPRYIRARQWAGYM